ncbi:MAG: hypothetical protein DMG57_14090 [Acidobacteria bacterium]|nr:MAG: hypothetical protein DMG57_14090 [Acidobacteriota bacterium]
MSDQVERRDFLKLAGAAAIAGSLAGEEKPVRIGFVGVGNRGTGLVRIVFGHFSRRGLDAVMTVRHDNCTLPSLSRP